MMLKKWTSTKLSTLNNKSFGDPGNLVVNGHVEVDRNGPRKQ